MSKFKKVRSGMERLFPKSKKGRLISSITTHPMNESIPVDTIDNNNVNDYATKSLGLIPIDSSFRQWLLQTCTSSSEFDSFILVMILLNTIMMACVDYRFIDENYQPTSEKSFRNKLLEKAEILFMMIFITECLMKIMAFGFIKGNRGYLKSTWNIFDFLIVLCR